MFGLCIFVSAALASDWPELRGPNRDAISAEKNLPEKWSVSGENLIWRAPYGSMSGPVILGNRIYLQNTVGEGATFQERIVCLDANTGKLVWESRFNLNHTDVPPQRVGWATPGLDPETGYVFAFTANGKLAAFTREGVPLWARILPEEFGVQITDNGRVVSPVIDGPLVIVSGITANWGDLAASTHRFIAFDKRTGDAVWISSAVNRPYDTSSSPPIVAEVDGVRLLIGGGTDGAWHALKVSTGEAVWRYEVAKGGVNTAAVRVAQDLILTHDEGMAAVNLSLNPQLKSKWARQGLTAGFTSPVSDGQRVYRIDNNGQLAAFGVSTGEPAWSLKLGASQKASPVLADGKLYVGTEDRKFFILRPRADGCDILSEVTLGNAQKPERVTAGAAISSGRVYFTTSEAVYAVGRSESRALPFSPIALPNAPAVQDRVPAHVQLIPADVALHPGQPVKFRVRLFDAKGNFIRDEAPPPPAAPQRGAAPPAAAPATPPQAPPPPPKPATDWSVDKLAGAVQPDFTYTPPNDGKPSTGKVKVKVGNLEGETRIRVMPLQWQTGFDGFEAGSVPAWWLNARDKFAVKAIDGNNVLAKLGAGRARTFAGLRAITNYATQADVRLTTGDGGIVAQGYELVLLGGGNRIELRSWQPETARTVAAPMPVKPDTWYRMKLQAELLIDGSVRVRGKAWPVADPEPDKWFVERTDKPAIAILTGSPGLYADSPAEIYFDNFKVWSN